MSIDRANRDSGLTQSDLPATTAFVRAQLGGKDKVLLWRAGSLIDPDWASLDTLLQLRRSELEEAVAAVSDTGHVRFEDVDLLAPAESQEVWAAGVTYGRSREARVEEAVESTIYDRVYGASRPEIFFKASGWRVVGPGQGIGIRSDSSWDVPEPELALLVNGHGETIAYAVGNDMSSRSIEAANPLYLPQAKIYDRSCALGPAAVLIADADPGEITLEIARQGEIVFEGSAHPSTMIRSHEELIGAITNWYSSPHGFWLMTGTGIVPPLEFTLHPGDIVSVSIDGLGTLRNPVVTVGPRSSSDDGALEGMETPR